MTATCHPLPPSTIQILFQDMARALCDRPEETPAQRESRTTATIRLILGFEPRDGVEFMLTTMATGHFSLILDAIRDVFQGQADSVKARTKSGIVALDRSMLTLLREFRGLRTRPVAEEARPAEARAGQAMARPSWPETATGTATPPMRADTPGNPAPLGNGPPGNARVASSSTRPVPSETRGAPVPGTPIHSGPAQGGAGETIPARTVPVQARSGEGQDTGQVGAAAPRRTALPCPAHAIPPRAGKTDMPEESLAAFQEAFRAMEETLAEARSHDRPAGEARPLQALPPSSPGRAGG